MHRLPSVEISVVVPAYNEEKRLETTLPHLYKSLKRRFFDFEIIVVDDGSVDGTADVVSRFAAKHAGVRLIRYEKNRGKGFAVRTGVLAGQGNYVLFCDADLSTPMREVRKLLGALAEGCDIAIGSRAIRGSRILKYQPFYRVLLGKTFNKFVQLFALPGIFDTQCGFKCFRRQVARDIFSRCRIDGFSFDVEVLYVARKTGFRVREVGVLWRNDPRSTVHPIRHSLQMLKELFAIRLYGLLGRYNGQVAMVSKVKA